MKSGEKLLKQHAATDPNAKLAAFATPTWVDNVAKVPLDEMAMMVAEDPSVVTALIGAIRHERAELARIRPVFDLACELQDADQCEDHSTGDDCDQGDVETKLFPALVLARQHEPERTDPLPRGSKKRAPAVASAKEHVMNVHDECVSWCPACLENKSRGLNPDGTTKS